jgi:hypothetical protein
MVGIRGRCRGDGDAVGDACRPGNIMIVGKATGDMRAPGEGRAAGELGVDET